MMRAQLEQALVLRLEARAPLRPVARKAGDGTELPASSAGVGPLSI
jgi:hypothetical protein